MGMIQILKVIIGPNTVFSVSFFLGNVMYGVCVCACVHVCVHACVCACAHVCTYNGVLVVIAPCPRSVCIYCLCFSSEIND